MSARSSRSRRRPASDEVIQKPRGSIQARVQDVGPERFGIISVDCAKARCKWMLANFYGKILVPPTKVAHNRVELDALISLVQQAATAHGLGEVLVAVER